MSSLDRIIKKERKLRYRKLKKLFKARDMASKHIDRTMKISLLDKALDTNTVNSHFTGNLAKMIIDTHKRILGITIRPPKPPSQRI